jgi:hypothetical protein
MCSCSRHSLKGSSDKTRYQTSVYGDMRLMPGLSANDVRNMIECCLSPLGLTYELQEVVFVPEAETPRSGLLCEGYGSVH